MGGFEWNLHTQISGGDSILSTTFCVDHVVETTFYFCSLTLYDITIGNDVASDDRCDFIMGHDIVMGTYHDVTMHTDVARALIYYVLLQQIFKIVH